MTHEEALLGACLINRNALGVAQEEIEASDFLRDSHRHIFEAMIRVQDRLGADEMVDPITVCTELGKKLEQVGGKAYIHTLTTMCPAASNVREYARQIRDAATHHRIRRICQRAIENEMGGAELQAYLEDGLYREERPSAKPVLMNEALEQAAKGDESEFVLAYPWPGVQDHTLGKGIRNGQLVILAGRPSHGKTAASIALTDSAMRYGRSVLFFSLEMGPTELAERLKLRNQDVTLDPEKYEKWRIVTTATRVSEMIPYVRRYRPDLVVVDYLQLLDIGSDTRTEGTTKSTRNLKLMAMRYDIPVVALSQLNRSGGDNQLPGLQRLRDSGSIEQDADHVVFVWRKLKEDTQQLTNEGAFVVAKMRSGTTGAARFVWHGEQQHFEDVTVPNTLNGTGEAQ